MRSLREQDAPDELAAQDPPGAVVVPLPTSRSNVGRHRNVGAPQKHAASELAIHSYDSLSAPQVVQRLAGLSRDEVAAVRAYEAATSARRTIRPSRTAPGLTPQPGAAPACARLALEGDIGRLVELYSAAVGELSVMRGGRVLIGLNGRDGCWRARSAGSHRSRRVGRGRVAGWGSGRR